MATIRKHKRKWQALVRRVGHKAIIKSFRSKTEAKKWARSMENKLETGDFSDYSEASKVILGDLFKRYISENKQKKNNFNLCSSSKPKNNPKAPKPKPIIQLKTLLG